MSAPDRKSEIRELLLAGGLFNAVDSAMLEAIEQELESVRLPGGQTLFSQGDAGDSLYVLAHGRLSVSIAVDGHEQVIGEVGRGQVVGESDKIGGDVKSNPISPKDILASAFHLLGIDPHTTVPDPLGRPVPVAGDGVVHHELFA